MGLDPQSGSALLPGTDAVVRHNLAGECIVRGVSLGASIDIRVWRYGFCAGELGNNAPAGAQAAYAECMANMLEAYGVTHVFHVPAP